MFFDSRPEVIPRHLLLGFFPLKALEKSQASAKTQPSWCLPEQRQRRREGGRPANTAEPEFGSPKAPDAAAACELDINERRA